MTRKFVDTETTGLDDRIHQAYEVAVMDLDSEDSVTVYRVPHSLEFADPYALSIGNYWGRGFTPFAPTPQWEEEQRLLLTDLAGATFIGSNPDFDKRFLRRLLGTEVWKHRTINVTDMALTVFEWDEPRGLAAVVSELQNLGHDIPEADHTAGGDVLATRAVYQALRAERGAL